METVDALLPRGAGSALAPLAALLGSRLEEVRGQLGTDVGELVRMCVHASSLRGVGAIGEFATRSLGRILQLESAQLDLRRDDEAQPRLVSYWRPHDSEVEPIDAPTTRPGRHARSVAVGRRLRHHRRAPGRHRRRLRAPDRVAAAARRRRDRCDHRQALERGAVTRALGGGDALRPAHRRAGRRRLRPAARAESSGDRPAHRPAQPPRLRGAFPGGAAALDPRPAPVAIIVCDCDGLKRMNDVRGHVQGDALLELVASCFRTHKRSGDVAARYGGDEFALLLPEAEIETALAVAERLRAAVAEEIMAGFRLSASFGVAAFPDHGRRLPSSCARPTTRSTAPSSAAATRSPAGRPSSAALPSDGYAVPNRATARARARSASTSRSRGGAAVTSASRRCRVACATSSTARSNAASFACDGFVVAAHLADVLERCAADLLVGRGRLEVVERVDVSAHADNLRSRGCAASVRQALMASPAVPQGLVPRHASYGDGQPQRRC